MVGASKNLPNRKRFGIPCVYQGRANRVAFVVAGVALRTYSAPQVRNVGPHSPSEERQACLAGAGRANLHAEREYPADF